MDRGSKAKELIDPQYSFSEELTIEPNDDRNSPDKVKKSVYYYSLILGYAVLTPWNGVLTSMYYFELLYEPAGYSPDFTLPMIIFFPLVACQLLLIAFGKNFPMRAKIVGSLAMVSLIFHLFILFCRGISNKDISFAVAVIMTLLMGSFNAFAQSSGGGLTGAMGCGGKYMGAYMFGNGISGIFTNLLQMFCLFVVGNKEEDSFKVAMLFFTIASFTMMASTYASYMLVEDPLTVKVIKDMPPEKPLADSFRLIWPTFKSQGKNVFFVFFQTFLVFPGVFLAKPLECLHTEWSIAVMLLLFNLFDTIGRYFPSYYMLASPKGTTIISIIRVLSPISFCLIGFGAFDDFFVADWWIILNVIVFAFTNGAFSTLAMMYGPLECEEKDRDDVGKIMMFFLTFGIFAGAATAQLFIADLIE